ncbi:MAG: hypothetical protein ACHQQ3_08340 [Gemmatimonadales bacterium]
MANNVTLATAVVLALLISVSLVPGAVSLEGGERTLFKRFPMSRTADVWHWIVLLAALAAWLHSRAACVVFLTTFGSYYALDSVYWLVSDAMARKPWVSNVVRALPHAVLGAVMLAAAHLDAR